MAQPHDQAAHAPDPDEDDLDDLDDVLDEFQPTPAAKPPAQPSQPPPTLSGPGRPPNDASFPDANSEALAAQLQAGMADLMSELDSNPDMQKQFEQMMSELIAVGSAPSDAEAEKHLKAAVDGLPKMPEEEEPEPEPATSTAGGSSKSKPTKSGKKAGSEEDAFSSTIRKTMARMQASDSTASASATTTSETAGGSEEDMLAQMMRELQSSSGAGGEGGEEGDFNTMLMNMMTQLTNKEILYEPMKELHDKFPDWMERHKADGSVKGEDMARYVEQQKLVGEIVGRFERKGYTDDNEGDREFIVERMQKMQGAGSPPPDLVGDMSAAQEALGDLDQGCPTQ
ncbi:Peroxisome chaperone and import receptor [Elasticomyces elasticus]|nr:Peroxisome chaperone and import receptor [Elasticomyces elasticus]KAK3665606.1 Peroxisome chaperone and import receptor [Elasticomyces elasticus]KAK4930356.1 Peroxisome chaperone and import receptor [Elasticomyces elasticus]KAK5768917.1 Peroxisome chaperone and import receptor [Elasticomyces elasticus]